MPSIALRWHFKHGIVLTRVLDHLQPEIVVRSHFSDWRTINLQRFDLLSEIGGVPVDVDYIANTQHSAGLELHGDDRQVAVIMGYYPDALL